VGERGKEGGKNGASLRAREGDRGGHGSVRGGITTGAGGTLEGNGRG